MNSASAERFLHNERTTLPGAPLDDDQPSIEQLLIFWHDGNTVGSCQDNMTILKWNESDQLFDEPYRIRKLLAK